MSIMQAMAGSGKPLPAYVGANVYADDDGTFSLSSISATALSSLVVACGATRQDNSELITSPSGFTAHWNVANSSGYVASRSGIAGAEVFDFEWDGGNDANAMFFGTFRNVVHSSSGTTTSSSVPGATFPSGGGFSVVTVINQSDSAAPELPSGWNALASGGTTGTVLRGHLVAIRQWPAGASGDTEFPSTSASPRAWVHLFAA